jgi:hypothetical protein
VRWGSGANREHPIGVHLMHLNNLAATKPQFDEYTLNVRGNCRRLSEISPFQLARIAEIERLEHPGGYPTLALGECMGNAQASQQ